MFAEDPIERLEELELKLFPLTEKRVCQTGQTEMLVVYPDGDRLARGVMVLRMPHCVLTFYRKSKLRALVVDHAREISPPVEDQTGPYVLINWNDYQHARADLINWGMIEPKEF